MFDIGCNQKCEKGDLVTLNPEFWPALKALCDPHDISHVGGFIDDALGLIYTDFPGLVVGIGESLFIPIQSERPLRPELPKSLDIKEFGWGVDTIPEEGITIQCIRCIVSKQIVNIPAVALLRY